MATRDETILRQTRALDIPGQAVIATNAVGDIVFWNEAAESIYGWPAHEVLGRNVLEVTPAPQSQNEATALMESFRSGKSWRGEFAVRHRDGALFHVRVMDTPVVDSFGEVIGVIGISWLVDSDAQTSG